MNIDLVKTLKESLDILDCDPAIIDDIDHHSTIAMELEGLPSLLLSQLEQGVMLWCKVAEYHPQKLVSVASELIEPLTDCYEWSTNGQVQLLKSDNYFELRTMLNEKSVTSGQLLAQALVDFTHLLQYFQRVLC